MLSLQIENIKSVIDVIVQINQCNVGEYFIRQENQSDKQIKNLGCIDSAKQEGNIRLFHTNPNGFGPNAYEKI